MNPSRFIWILATASVIIMSGCRPRGVLSSRQMRHIMADLHETDALLQVSGIKHNNTDAQNLYYAVVLNKHGVTQAQFDSSLVWYTSHPQLFDKIYPKVLNDLAAKREAFEQAHAEELAPSLNNRTKPVKPRISQAQAQEYTDSVLWVSVHGYPTLWRPYPHIPAHPIPLK